METSRVATPHAFPSSPSNPATVGEAEGVRWRLLKISAAERPSPAAGHLNGFGEPLFRPLVHLQVRLLGVGVACGQVLLTSCVGPTVLGTREHPRSLFPTDFLPPHHVLAPEQRP